MTCTQCDFNHEAEACPNCGYEEPTLVMNTTPEVLTGVMGTINRNGKPDFTVIETKLEGAGMDPTGHYFCISWGTKSAGFGELTFYTEGGKLWVDSEGMSKKFQLEVLKHFIEQAEDPHAVPTNPHNEKPEAQ